MEEFERDTPGHRDAHQVNGEVDEENWGGRGAAKHGGGL